MTIALEMERIGFSYGNGRVLDDISLALNAGEMVGLLGPNGSGKTTLLKVACGLLNASCGEVRLGGARLDCLERRAIARSVAVVPQRFHIPFAFTVSEIVALGRTPFLGLLAGEGQADREVVSRVMAMVGISGMAARPFDELSGGERQKVVLAMALAQQPGLLLLDEPTVHLDIAHQAEILGLVRQLNADHGLTVLTAIHDLNLAALYFDRLVLLKQGQVCADGPPGEVLTEERIGEVFAAPVRVERHPETGVPYVVVLPWGGDGPQGH